MWLSGLLLTGHASPILLLLFEQQTSVRCSKDQPETMRNHRLTLQIHHTHNHTHNCHFAAECHINCMNLNLNEYVAESSNGINATEERERATNLA